MTRWPAVVWEKVDPPTSDRPGFVRFTMTLPRKAEPVRVIAEARSGQQGWAIAVPSDIGPMWSAGLVFAEFRWTPGDGPADLVLSWPAMGNTWVVEAADQAGPPGMNFAEVSDVLILAKDPTAQRAVRAFLDALPGLGRPVGTIIENDEQVRAVIETMRRDGRKVTMESVAATSGTFTYANLRYYLRVNGKTWRDISRIS